MGMLVCWWLYFPSKLYPRCKCINYDFIEVDKTIATNGIIIYHHPKPVPCCNVPAPTKEQTRNMHKKENTTLLYKNKSSAGGFDAYSADRPVPTITALTHAGFILRSASLHRHLHLDGLVRQVALDLEVFKLERVDVGLVGRVVVYGQGGERTRLAPQLLPKRVDVVEVDVGVADGVNEFARLQAAHLGGFVGAGCSTTWKKVISLIKPNIVTNHYNATIRSV